MKTDHIKRDIFFWVLAVGVSGVVGLIGGYLFGLALFLIANAPPDYSFILGIPVGSLFFLFTLRWFGVKIDSGSIPF
jgi:hypothetical protein